MDCLVRMRIVRVRGGTNHFIDAAHAFEVILTELLQANLFQKVLLPALDTAVYAHGHKSLLTHDTAETPRLAARRHMRQCIREIIELALIEHLLRHVVLQPQHFWDFHLDGHLAADIAEEVVLCSVDAVGFFHGAVVEPEDHVAVVAVFVVEVGAGDADGGIGVFCKDGEGAGGIEADAADGGWVDVILGEGAADGEADAAPDVCCRLLLRLLVSMLQCLVCILRDLALRLFVEAG